jgi:hypothetical protein
MNHLIVLFKNKKRKKIINRFKTIDRAKEFFSKKVSESENVIFEKQVENALPCSFEIALVSKKDNDFQSLFVKDSLGRQVRVNLDDDDFKIIEVNEYRIEEKIFDVYQNKKITTQEFLKKYINTPSIKLLSKLNNKVVLQNDDNVDLFTLKDPEECTRFLRSLSDYFISTQRMDVIVVYESFFTKVFFGSSFLGSSFASSKAFSKTNTCSKPDISKENLL